MGLFDFLKGTENGATLCERLHNNFSVDDPKRKPTIEYVLSKGADLQEPLAYLACAFAFSYKGAETRQNAIVYFERYLQSPTPCKDYSFYDVYLELGKLQEAEYDFEKAIFCYERADDEFRRIVKKNFKSPLDPSPNVKLGRLYLKISTQKAIDFWELEKRKPEYKKYKSYKREVDVELANALEKHSKGYVYKPRKTKGV